MKVVTLDGFIVNAGGIEMELPGHEQVWYAATEPEQTAERIGDAEAVIVNRTAITREVIEACPALRYIGIYATGYNMVDLVAASERGITVCNAPGYSTAAVTQLTIGLLLEIAGRVGEFDRLVRGGGWTKGGGRAIVAVPTRELAGRVLGIFGAGEIGRSVGRVAAALGMEVLGCRRNPPPDGDGIRYVDADTLLAQSDVVSIHTPLTDETKGYFGAATIAKMKDGAILLNTARGAILDEAAVAAALDSGKLLALGADVLTAEPPEPGNPLAGHPRAVITPHVGWTPRETRQRLVEMVAENLLAFEAGRPQNVVNPRA